MSQSSEHNQPIELGAPTPASRATPPGLNVQLVSGPLDSVLDGEEAALFAVSFGKTRTVTGDPRHVHVDLEQLGGSDVVELWRTNAKAEYGLQDGIAWVDDGAHLFAKLELSTEQAREIDAASYHGYARLLKFCQRNGFSHWLRIWNYIADIGQGSGESERYQRFCVGRGRALDEFRIEEKRFPAATAIGTEETETGLLIYLLAGREAGLQVENPRQVSAFRYPDIYSPRSPSFARATLFDTADQGYVFVSGTASILGHATQHPGDVVAQLNETLQNMDALLGAAAHGSAIDRPLRLGNRTILKIYVRDVDLCKPLSRGLSEWFDGQPPSHVVLLGEPCRQDLLVEIEALHPIAP